MSIELSNYLYRHPELYDSVFRTAPTAPRLQDMARAVLSRYGKEPPATVFDIGCGTGFKLAHLRDTALGWVIENVHTRDDISCAMDTFAAHAEPGTLLLFDTHNPIGDLHAQGSRSEFSIDRGGLRARATATFDVDRRRQILTRRRVWEISDGSREEDLAHFRLFFPMELEHHLDQHGFDVLGMWDNTDLADSALDGSMLHVAASFRGPPAP